MKTIHHVLDIDASAATVWAALTRADGLRGWWSTTMETAPAAVGSRLYWTFSGDFNSVMEITRLEDGRELVWVCVAGHGPWQDGSFRFLVDPSDSGHTRLRFWQDYAVELDDDAYGIYNFNWGYYLESLRLYCTTGVGKPFQAAG